ncbi:hypothetical protein Tco_1475086 [Tanacetum coccineum]
MVAVSVGEGGEGDGTAETEVVAGSWCYRGGIGGGLCTVVMTMLVPPALGSRGRQQWWRRWWVVWVAGALAGKYEGAEMVEMMSAGKLSGDGGGVVNGSGSRRWGGGRRPENKREEADDACGPKV